MKICIVILSVMLLLCSCSVSNTQDASTISSSKDGNAQDTSTISSSKDEDTQDTSVMSSSEDESSQDKNNPSLQENSNVPANYPMSFDSFTDLTDSISQKNRDALYEKLLEAGTQKEQLDKVKVFAEKLQSQNVIVPYLSNKVIKLRNKDDYSNILLFSSETYGLPWLFYYPEVSTGENFYIKITYLPDNVVDAQKNPTASDVIKKISPNSPNVNNLGEQHEKIYNQNIKLNDREVTALICEYKTDHRDSMIFVYGDLLVEVRYDPEVWNEQWFSNLSFDAFD